MILKFFLSAKKNTADIAKERLKVIISKYKDKKTEPSYFPLLKRDIINVICKYTNISSEHFTINLDNKKNNVSILKLNITLSSVNHKK